MKKLLTAAVFTVAAVTASVGVGVYRSTTASADDPGKIVGAWEVTADAPYPPHLFMFNSDGTMLSTNPTNVQEKATAFHGGVNDSVGMGRWKVVEDNGDKYVEGTFEELNAFVDNHAPGPLLTVSFKIHVADDGKSFDGPAVATVVGVETDPSHLHGDKRITVDQDAVDTLHF